MKKGVPIVEGDLLDAKEQYIVQQCNCYTVRGHGLSKTIADRYGPPADPYTSRRPMGTRNLAIPEDRDKPGTVRILADRVVCLFAQLCPGKPHRFASYPNYQMDTTVQRVRWFKQCLEELERLGPTSLAFPWTIGCGLAGGNWFTYRAMIEDFAEKSKIPCTFYRL